MIKVHIYDRLHKHRGQIGPKCEDTICFNFRDSADALNAAESFEAMQKSEPNLEKYYGNIAKTLRSITETAFPLDRKCGTCDTWGKEDINNYGKCNIPMDKLPSSFQNISPASTSKHSGTKCPFWMEKKIMSSVRIELPKEITRVKEVQKAYREIDTPGLFAVKKMSNALYQAEKANAEQDVIGMIKALKKLQGFNF